MGQIDFMVLGLPGASGVEVKNWSRICKSGEYRSKYVQVDRASYFPANAANLPAVKSHRFAMAKSHIN